MVVFEKNGVFEFRARQLSDLVADYSPEFREIVATRCTLSRRLVATFDAAYLLSPESMREKIERECEKLGASVPVMSEALEFCEVLRSMSARGIWIDCNE